MVLFCFSANLSVNIDRQPIFFNRRYRPLTNFFSINQPGWSISTNFWILSIEPTINIDRNSPQVYDSFHLEPHGSEILILFFSPKNVQVTLSTALKFSSKFFRKRSFFDQNQQPLNNVEPFERILRALFIAQCPYKFSSFLDLRNGSSRFRLFEHDFQLFRFFFPGSACFSKVASPGKLQS